MTTHEAIVSMIGHNRLPIIARRLQAGYDRVVRGGKEWIEGTLEVASALKEGRDECASDVEFSNWLKVNNLKFYNADQRAILIRFGHDLPMARVVLEQSIGRSLQAIWREHKERFRQPTKPRRKKRDREGFSVLHRETKLGKTNVDRLKGTSLESAPEQEELLRQNRGSTDGVLKPEVESIIRDAEQGKLVSAIAETKGRTKANELYPAWKKRMVAPWLLATKAEREALIDYLINHLSDETQKRRDV